MTETFNLQNYTFIEKLKKLDFVERIWLYGSWARGDAKPNSDIDLAIFCPTATEHQWQQIKNIVFDADALRKIDCIRLDTLPESAFKKNIIRDKKLIYQRESYE